MEPLAQSLKGQFDIPSYVWSGVDEQDEDLLLMGPGCGNHHQLMPASPDSVEKTFVPLAGTGINPGEDLVFNFDPDLFFGLDKQAIADLEAFRLFDNHAPELEEDTASEETRSLSSADSPKLNSIVTAQRSVAAVIQDQPLKKRSKTLAVATDSGSEDESKTKKIKASPKLPRSRKPTSAFRGVSRCTKDGRWQARIRIAKEVVYLGRFPTEEQAARRYDEAARLHHGAQAMLNFVTPEDVLLGRKSVFSSDKNAVLSEDEF